MRYAVPPGDDLDLPEGVDAQDVRRVLRVDDVHVTASAPADLETCEEDGNLVLRIGDPDETVTAEHTYRLQYR